jgi:hypothetical protein
LATDCITLAALLVTGHIARRILVVGGHTAMIAADLAEHGAIMAATIRWLAAGSRWAGTSRHPGLAQALE